MTVIAAVKSNHGKKGVVIGSDKVVAKGNLEMAQWLRHFEFDEVFDLPGFIGYLKKVGIDKIKIRLERKIKVSKDNQSVLTETGAINEPNKRITQLLLDLETFLQDDTFLKEMLFPLKVPEKVANQALENYKSSFDLKERIRQGYSPEIRRIADMFVVEKYEISLPGFKKAYWDRTYNPRLSEYLFATLVKHEGRKIPLLLDISITGTMYGCEYNAKGAGEEYALEYMRERLGTGKPLLEVENKVEKQVSLNEAEDIVKGAIDYANEKSPLCKGLDYVILTEEGIEKHFSQENGKYELSLTDLIESRLKELRHEIRLLKKAKKEYEK